MMNVDLIPQQFLKPLPKVLTANSLKFNEISANPTDEHCEEIK